MFLKKPSDELVMVARVENFLLVLATLLLTFVNRVFHLGRVWKEF